MRDNSPTIGGILHAIESTMRKVEWRVVAANDGPEAQEMAEFVEECMDDMSSTWEDTVSEILTMVPFGYAPLEIVYKRRNGGDPGADPDNPGEDLPASRYDDGKIGWRRLPLRGQDTVLKWFFNANGMTKGLTQQPYVGPLIDVPIEKMLLFRARPYKQNPEGLALDPETPIPTPDGWRVLDDLEIGDKVFDEDGRIRYVAARAEWEDRPCYRVTFNDGTEIIADAKHEWITTTLYDRLKGKPAKKRNTEQIAQTIKTHVGSSNHAIAWSGQLDYAAQLLPLDPYFLGLWLGDGTSVCSSIACHMDDVEETRELIEAAGYQTEVEKNGRPGGKGRSIKVFGEQRWDSQGPQALLRALGLRGNKHIPEPYMRGSIEQRRALLAGLMDSDGTVDDYGRCEFNNSNTGLIYGLAELVRSLGCSARVCLRRRADTPSGAGRLTQDHWCVRFRPEWTPFRLSRKSVKVRGHRARDQHYIVSAESVENRRTVCIEVDSPSHMFLAGVGMIPTCNSCLRNSYVPYYYIKRMQEQEAILAERLCGLPHIKVPMQLLEAASSGDANAARQLDEYKRIGRNVRIDEQMCVILPSNMYEGLSGPTASPMYSFELITPEMTRSGVEFDKTITRYKVDMMTSLMADFLALGHEARGTQSLAVSKVDMFFQAVEGWLNSAAAVFDRYGLPRLWRINGFDEKLMPHMEPDLAQRVDLDVLSNFVLRLSQAGMPMFPNEELEQYILDAAGLPDVTDERAIQAAGMDDASLEIESKQKEEALAQQQLRTENLKNPPEPDGKPPGGPPSNLTKMIAASAAKRQRYHSGPRFGVWTKKRHRHRAKK